MTRRTLVLLALQLCLCAPAFAATQQDLEKFGEQLDTLTDELLKLQEKMLENRTPQLSQANLAYDYLDSCGNVLTSINRDVTAMIQVLRISQFIWDPAARKMATPYIDRQAQSLTTKIRTASNRLGTLIPRVGDVHASKVCLQIRDLMQAGIPIAGNLKPSWNETK